MLKKFTGAVAALALVGLAGCSGGDRTADNIPRPILNSERMNTDATTGSNVNTTTTDNTVGSNPNSAADTSMNTDSGTLSTTQSAAGRPSATPSPSHSAGAAGAHGTTGTGTTSH